MSDDQNVSNRKTGKRKKSGDSEGSSDEQFRTRIKVARTDGNETSGPSSNEQCRIRGEVARTDEIETLWQSGDDQQRRKSTKRVASNDEKETSGTSSSDEQCRTRKKVARTDEKETSGTSSNEQCRTRGKVARTDVKVTSQKSRGDEHRESIKQVARTEERETPGTSSNEQCRTRERAATTDVIVTYQKIRGGEHRKSTKQVASTDKKETSGTRSIDEQCGSKKKVTRADDRETSEESIGDEQRRKSTQQVVRTDKDVTSEQILNCVSKGSESSNSPNRIIEARPDELHNPSGVSTNVMKTGVVVSDGQSDKCVILCFCNYANLEAACPDASNQTFSSACLEEWAKHIEVCPVYRQTFALILEILKRLPVGPPRSHEDDWDLVSYCAACHKPGFRTEMFFCGQCIRCCHFECSDPPPSDIEGPVFCPLCNDQVDRDGL